MSRVWIVSGIVLIGTGFALAGFGYWLAGNPNCDAGDLGRACVSASLGVAVIGAALTLGGWMRIKRLGQQDEGAAREEGGTQILAVMIAVALAGIILLSVVPPYASLPVDVYAHPPPAFNADPAQFLVDGLGGRPRESLVNVTDVANNTTTASAAYQGGVSVKVTRFLASNSTMLPLAEVRAGDYLDHAYPSKASASASHACVKSGDRQWFVVDGAAGAQLAWRRANFVVEVLAPSPQVRDAVAAALAI